ncbi:hypothetical protein GCM10022403_088640 [Streptomyces coacervatus]|uniref:Lipoprotein n=1 Tax=Streptomyces coacervatus TaxID=647381 RepID=A0ABP7JE71_9ACTN|nr:hypothetical protein [Streptomyces coacervatus]MDF2271288.1 hypothetical protein [Streptomyces coacervatus]
MATPKKGSSVTPHRILLASAAGLASVLLLAACGSSNDNASGTSPVSSAPATTAAPDPAASAPVASATAPADGGNSGSGEAATTAMVMARAMTGGGHVVTDEKGMTLYRYDKDRPNPSRWTCTGECVKTWIPVIVPDSVRTMGIEKSLLGTVHRDGRTQLTLAGWPLYRYVGDTAAGQLNGQGKDRQWYAVTPSGAKVAGTG